ncbi:MAG: hypothetical protein ACREP0_00730, partial [Rhodanobacteraceae bacterium]
MLLTGHAPATPAQPGRAAPTVSRRRTPWLWAAAAVSLVALGAGLAWWLVPRGIAADAPALP